MKIEHGTVDITDLPITNGFQHFDISAISKPIEVQFTWQHQPRLSVGNIVTIGGSRYRITFAECVGEALELQVEPL
mgnify:CR=1 FL=1